MSDTDPTIPDLAAAAVEYTDTGWAVLPLHWSNAGNCSCGDSKCGSAGKHPLIPNGVHGASDDSDQVAAWWRRWPTANIGIAVPADVIVIDIDPRSSGEATWSRLRAGQSAPSTLTSISGRGDGGRHHWLRHPGGTVKGSLGAGIDVKKSGGYLVGPPSVHAASGRPYRWVDPAEPITDCPAWLLEQLHPAPVNRTPIRTTGDWSPGHWNPAGLLHAMETAGEGRRNKVLHWCACRIGDDVRSGRAPERDALDALRLLAGIAENNGLSEHEVDATIESGYLR